MIDIILICIGCIFILYGFYKTKKAHQLFTQKNTQFIKQKALEQQQKENIKKRYHELSKLQETIKYQNNFIKEQNQELQNKNNDLIALNTTIQKKKDQMRSELEHLYQTESNLIIQRLEDFKNISTKAAEQYSELLEKDYESADAAHKQHIANLQAEYNQTAAALTQLKETRKAAQQALLKEKEIQANKDFYRLIPLVQDLNDIHTLEKIKSQLNRPRILSMLIWQTFWQPLAKKQFPLILQGKDKIGIYKITNLETNEAYIGQSVNIYKRWCEHCKAGLGIDTPVGNKLYQSIQHYGLQNFTFEVLCQCDKEELNEKENYFIELYQSDIFGFNGNIGINK